MGHKKGILEVQRAEIIPIFAVTNIRGGAAYVDRKGNE